MIKIVVIVGRRTFQRIIVKYYVLIQDYFALNVDKNDKKICGIEHINNLKLRI